MSFFRLRTVLSMGFLLLASTAFGALDATPVTCPDRGSPERAEDCPWAGVARAMIAASERQDPSKLAPLFRSMVPEIVAQLRADSRRADVKDLWGRSINFDEGAKGQIVHPSILSVIGEAIEIPYLEGPGNIVHAGMEHTYGYLFSNLVTPFGYKRARWVQGEIERGFGLTPGILGPYTREGTLLLNVTSFIGQIAFRAEQNEMRVVQKAARDAAREIQRFNYAGLNVSRLVERLEVPNENGKIRPVKIYTDLVRFTVPTNNPKANSYLLIYTVVDPFSHGAQLITAFPVHEEFARRVFKDPSGPANISTRYNGFVMGLTGTTLPGERRVFHRRGFSVR